MINRGGWLALALVAALAGCASAHEAPIATCDFGLETDRLAYVFESEQYGRPLTESEIECTGAVYAELASPEDVAALCPHDPLAGCYTGDGTIVLDETKWATAQGPARHLVILHLLTHRLLECVAGNPDFEHNHPALVDAALAWKAISFYGSEEIVDPLVPCD